MYHFIALLSLTRHKLFVIFTDHQAAPGLPFASLRNLVRRPERHSVDRLDMVSEMVQVLELHVPALEVVTAY